VLHRPSAECVHSSLSAAARRTSVQDFQPASSLPFASSPSSAFGRPGHCSIAAVCAVLAHCMVNLSHLLHFTYRQQMQGSIDVLVINQYNFNEIFQVHQRFLEFVACVFWTQCIYPVFIYFLFQKKTSTLNGFLDLQIFSGRLVTLLAFEMLFFIQCFELSYLLLPDRLTLISSFYCFCNRVYPQATGTTKMSCLYFFVFPERR